jgi:hypothetical protein
VLQSETLSLSGGVCTISARKELPRERKPVIRDDDDDKMSCEVGF